MQYLNIEDIYNTASDDSSRESITELSYNFNHLKNGTEYINTHENEILTQELNYKLNFTVKQLLTICEYYNIDHTVKQRKLTKYHIISAIVAYEEDENNKVITARRQFLWFCMNELRNDKCMKKYIIW